MSLELLQNSLALAAVATLLALVMAWPVALAAQCFGAWGRWAILVGSLLTLALPGFFVAGMWMEWIGFAGAWRVGGGAVSDRWMPVGVSSVVLAAMLWPVGVLLLTGAWDRWDGRLLEAEPALTGTFLVRRVLWPTVLPACVAPAVVIAMLALGNFAVPALFQARVWPAEVWVEYSTRFDAGSAWGKCWPLVGLAAGLWVWASRCSWTWPMEGKGTTAKVWRERLGKGWVTGLVLTTLGVLGLGLGLPLATALASPRTWTELVPALRAAGPAAVRTMAVSAATATTVVLVAMVMVRWRSVGWTGVLFVVPGVFTGMACAELAGWGWLDGFRDLGGLMVVALAARYVFVGWLLMRRLWLDSGGRRREWVALSGGTRWQIGWHGVMRGNLGPLAGVWCLVYLLSLWDVETQILVVPPGGETLGLMIFNLLHYGRNAQVTALCLLLGLLAVTPGCVGWIASRWPRGARGWATTSGLWMMWVGAGCGSGHGPEGAGPPNSKIFERVEVIGGKGTGPGFFSKPRSVAVDARGSLYVVDMTGRVQRFGATGAWERSWQMPETVLGRPKGMAAAVGSGVWVVEPHYHRVNRFDAEGRSVAQWGEHGLEPGRLWFPRAIALAEGGVCYVSEYGRVERIQRFRADTGEYLGSFGEEGTGPGQLNRPEGLAVGPDGNVYVADSCNHRVQVFSAEGRFVREHGRAGRGRGELSYPYDVQLDGEGRQYVCEFGNSRVQIFGPDDRPLEILGGPGSAPGELNNPWSLCLDREGNLYVADALNHRVVRYVRRRGMAGGGEAGSSAEGRRG